MQYFYSLQHVRVKQTKGIRKSFHVQCSVSMKDVYNAQTCSCSRGLKSESHNMTLLVAAIWHSSLPQYGTLYCGNMTLPHLLYKSFK